MVIRLCFLEKHYKRVLMETKPEVFTASLKQRTARLKVKPTVHFPCPKEIVFNESVHGY